MAVKYLACGVQNIAVVGVGKSLVALAIFTFKEIVFKTCIWP